MIRIPPPRFALPACLALGLVAGPAWAASTTAAPVPVREQLQTIGRFGEILWHREVVFGPRQNACLGDRYYGPGASVAFAVIAGRFHDRLYFRTDGKILHEWTVPVPTQPDSAESWAAAFVDRFAAADTLFLEMHESGDPVVATGRRAARMSALFRRWVAQAFTPDDWSEAAALGIPTERFMGPAPETICPMGSG